MRYFEQLYLTDNIQFGYGVLYADGATKTQRDVNKAYGYHADGPDPEAKQKGMRGMFAYYWNVDDTTSEYRLH